MPALSRLNVPAWAAGACLALAGCAGTGLSVPELNVVLSGVNEVPPNRSAAAGKGTFWVHSDRTLNGLLETSGMQSTAANLYLGGPGVTGPVVLQMIRNSSVGPVAMEHAPVSGASWSVPRSARLDEEQYRALLAGEMYVNVHSARYPEGEVRGQIKP